MKYLIFIIFFFLITYNLKAETIGTINFQKIYAESLSFNNFIDEINVFKEEKLKFFTTLENSLKKEKEELESSKLILSNDEYIKKVKLYEKNIQNYKKEVDLVNNEIYQKIEKGKNVIKNDVINIVQKLAVDQNISIIFDANDYINWSGEFDNMDNYINMMKRTSTWGGAIEIKAFCNMYNHNVNVVDTKTGRIINFLPNTTKYSNEITINWNGGHYWK